MGLNLLELFTFDFPSVDLGDFGRLSGPARAFLLGSKYSNATHHRVLNNVFYTFGSPCRCFLRADRVPLFLPRARDLASRCGRF